MQQQYIRIARINLFLLFLSCLFSLGTQAGGGDSTQAIRVVAQTGHRGIFGAKFSNDDQLLYTYTKEGEIHAWDPATLKQVRTYLGHAGRLVQLWVFGQGIVSRNERRFFTWHAGDASLHRTITLLDSAGDYKASIGHVRQYGDRYLLARENIQLPGKNGEGYNIDWKIDLLSGTKQRLHTSLMDDLKYMHPRLPLLVKTISLVEPEDKLIVVLRESSAGSWDTAWQQKASALGFTPYHNQYPELTPDGGYVYFRADKNFEDYEPQKLREKTNPYLFFPLHKNAPALPAGNIFHYEPLGEDVVVHNGEWQLWREQEGRITTTALNDEAVDSVFQLDRALLDPQWYDAAYYADQMPEAKSRVVNHAMTASVLTGEHQMFLLGATGKILRNASFKVAAPEALYVAADENRFIIVSSGDKKDKPRYWEWQVGDAFPLQTFTKEGKLPSSIASAYRIPESDTITTRSKYKVIVGETWHMSYYRGLYGLTLVDSAGRVILLEGHSSEVSQWAFNREETLLASVSVRDVNSSLSNDIKVWQVEKGVEWKRMLDVGEQSDFYGGSLSSLSSSIKGLVFTGDSKYLWGAYPRRLVKWDINTGIPVGELEGFAPFALATGDSLIAATAALGQQAVVYDARSGQIRWRFTHHAGEITSMKFLRSNRYLLTAAKDGKTKLWDLATGEEILNIVQFNDGQSYVILTPANYYLGSRESINELNFVVNNKAWSYEPFDLALNRPDKVLQQVQSDANANLVKALQLAWQKRVRRLGLDEEQAAKLPEMASLPLALISHAAEQGDSLLMQLRFSPGAGALAGYQVKVNGIPLYPGKGRLLYPATGITSVADTILLSSGANEVQVYCFDNAGRESLRQQWFSLLEDEQPRRRIYIGVGVSAYADSGYNLRYPVKDVEDLAQTFRMGEEFGFHSIILKDERATRSNILALKKELLNTRPDDEVIVSFNGHGMVDSKLNFYFATHDMNFKQPETKGLSYSDIGWLLEGIPSRKRLVLMDACHSGPIDTDNSYEVVIDTVITDGTRSSIKMTNRRQDASMMPAKHAFKLMQNLFTDISESNGAIVIAAAGGDEYALEGQHWNNGVFTFCVRQALEEDQADLDGDRSVSISELKSYVAGQVEKLTHGAQKPASRQDNPGVKWVLK